MLSRSIISIILFSVSSLAFANHSGLFFGSGYRFITANTSGGRSWSDGTVASSCGAYKNSSNPSIYRYRGNTGNGIYTITGNYNVYCDMTTDSGGWTMVASSWISNYDSSMDPVIKSLGQFTSPISSSIPFSSMRLECISTAIKVNRRRTYTGGGTTTNINVFNGDAYASTEYRLTDDTDPYMANWNQNGGFTELHFWYTPPSWRFIVRASDVHCSENYSAVGGETNNPRLGQYGRIWIR